MLELLMRFLPLVLRVVSPELAKELGTFLDNLEAKAKETANPWDDYFVAALRTILKGQ